MSDWSKIECCPECNAGNPAGEEMCINCGIDFQEARTKLQVIRQQNSQRIMKSRCPKYSQNNKPVDKLTISDLNRFPVWEFDLANEGLPGRDETWVKPVKDLPVTDLSNRVIGTLTQLASGRSVFCLFDNIELQNQQMTEQFIGLTIIKENGDRFFLSRYFDSNYDTHGPDALALFLEMPVDDVFPITYDISELVIGIEKVTKGIIQKENPEKLTDDERRALIFN